MHTHARTYGTQHLKRSKHEHANYNNSVLLCNAHLRLTQHSHPHITRTRNYTLAKSVFNHSYMKMPHNAQQETKHRDTNKVGFSIIYKKTAKIHNQRDCTKSIMQEYIPT